MAQVINTNVMSINAQRNLNMSQRSMATALERLSSGLRINRASDDAAGLGLAASFETQLRQDAMNIRNVGDGISFAQTGEAALGEVQNMVQRVLELQTQRDNGIYGGTSAEIDLEIGELVSEINVQLGATFNGNSINGGQVTVAGTQVGDSGAAVTTVTSGTISAGTTLSEVVTLRATYGAQTNRLEAQARYLEASYESNSAARSRVMDADFAQETANLTRAQILQQAGTAMLAQANAMPQNVLSLLR
jgi:flagellin